MGQESKKRMLSMKTKRTVLKKRLLQFSPRRQSALIESTIVLSCYEIADTKNDGRRSSKGNTPGGSSPSRRKRLKPRRNFLKGNSTKPSCDSWHPPVCQNYTNESGCKFGDMCQFKHAEVVSQPSKKPNNLMSY